MNLLLVKVAIVFGISMYISSNSRTFSSFYLCLRTLLPVFRKKEHHPFGRCSLLCPWRLENKIHLSAGQGRNLCFSSHSKEKCKRSFKFINIPSLEGTGAFLYTL